ncbi:heavy metal sensor histidine kinase [Burkholderia sp. FERM BP-3421]|jgi:two-component system heavy metal sensor histidine kinase CusS|uniref:heavy metal sensor histidine kinase n=1 Tax=Burkholderia sp. FERM BP-3421 TaxID=1494466 RepID=UPI00235F78F3|nr:heavy metal sensor histidine kinase [Burkholderia sp. FERM BP-3421]WDD91643.1 heavy metal sensor histidine kinase [Burkholderia sp. FERM BP-3421]
MSRFLPATLRLRLTVSFAICTALVLALSGLLLYESLRVRVERQADAQMDGLLGALRSHLGDAATPDAVAAQPRFWLDQLHGHGDLEIALFDARGRTLMRSPGLLDPPVADDARRLVPDSPLRYLTAGARLARGAGEPVRIVIQYNASSDRLLLHTLFITIVVIGVAGIVLMTALAYGISALGLSPLRQLVQKAQRISTSRLDERLPETGMTGELKEVSEAFNDMLLRLQRSFAQLSQFSSDLAHDIRTPLTNLLAESQVALSKPRSADEYRAVIESGVDEYRRLSRMVEDMLFLARSDNARQRIAPHALDARTEAERVAGYYEFIADEAGVQLDVVGHARVTADTLLLQRALSNLVSNALAHAPRDSTVTLAIEWHADETVLSVTDHGPGIAAEHLPHIFDRFYRVDPSRHHSASGTGLGLAIVQSIMRAHRGRCTVTSTPRVATTFSLHFPAASA